jgi:hypothetical protein
MAEHPAKRGPLPDHPDAEAQADIVEQFGDLEFRGGLFLGGQFLDRLAGGLKLGLFGERATFSDRPRRPRGAGSRVQAQFLDRTASQDTCLRSR